MPAEHRLAASARARDMRAPVEVHYQWRSQLSDAADEMVWKPP